MEFIQRKSSDASDDSNDGDRPKMAIMIIGKNWSEKCHMGNVILGSYAFGNCPPSDECEANTGLVDGRHLTVVLTRNLMNNQLTQEDLQQRVKECVSLCGPSPRAYILVAQPQDFTEDDHRIVKAILTSVLDQALGSTLVVKFLPEGEDEDEIGSSVDNIVDESDALRGLIQDCGGQCYRLNRKHVEDLVQAEILQTIENMDKDETHSVYEDASDIQKQKPESDCSPNMLGSFSEQVKANNKGKTSFKSKLSKLLQPSQKAGVETPKAPSQRLNLMLFGRKGVQKTAIGNTILLQSYPKLSSKSNFMKRRAEVCGYAVTLIEAPCLARTHLSFTQVLKKCHEAISLCAPGIDAFVLAVPSVTLTDDDKEELHQIQTIFGRHVNDHIMILCTYVSAPVALDSQAFKNLEQQFRKGCFVLSQKGRKEKISELLKKIKDESDKHFTTDMYMEAQIEERVRLQEEIMDLKKLKQQHGSPDTPDSTTDCVRIVLIGKTGVGKSATGNTILGKCAFETAIWGDSVTKFCQKGTAVINDQSVAVVDTPGLFDTTVSNEEVKKEILKCFSFLAPGPHVFLLVLAIGTRMTDEERETLNLIKEAFGDNAAKFIIILFTKEDQLKGHSIETYIQKSGPEVAQLIHSCEGRFHVFNNENKNNSKQVTELMGKIDLMVKKNGGGCYTNEMFQLAESAIKEKFEKIIREREKETEREKEQLQAKFEEELRAMMEKKTEEIERERKKREMMLREKEDFINNELKKRDEKEAKERKKREEEDERRREEERTQRLAWTDTLEELKRKHQAQKEEWETEHQRRLQEEKQRAERENQEWLEREEKQKYEFDRRQEEERKRRDREEIIRWEKEEREKMRLEEKVREAEKMTAQSLAERQKELRNWEDQRTKERQREEEENKKRIQNEREEWERLKNKMKEDFEKEKEREKKDREIDEIRKREHERKERERIENEYLNTMEQNQAKQKKQEQEWEKERDELRKKREKEDNENREKFKKLKDDFEREKDDEKRKREEEDKAKEEAHKQKLEEINQQHRKRVDELNTEIEKYKDEARQAAEEHNEFVKRYDELKGDLSGDDLKKAIKEWEKKHSKTCVLL